MTINISSKADSSTPLDPWPGGVSTDHMVAISQAELDELRADQELLHRLIRDDRALPDGPLWQAVKWLAEDLAVAKIRQLSHGISASRTWGTPRPSHAELERRRNTFHAPPRTPEQISRDAYASWALRDPKAA